MAQTAAIVAQLKDGDKKKYKLFDQAKITLREETEIAKRRRDKASNAARRSRLVEELTAHVDRLNSSWRELQDALVDIENGREILVVDYQAVREESEDFIDDISDVNQPDKVADTKIERKNPEIPKVVIPDFSGDKSAFMAFWILFKEIIHERENLSFGLKFSYLRAALKGKARDLIEGFLPTEDGYNDAVKLLRDTYESEGLKDDLYDTFLNIKRPRHTAADLSDFRQQYLKLVRSLSHCVAVKEQEELIKKILVQKLSSESLTFVINFNKTPHFSYAQLNEALIALIKVLESSSSQGSSHQQDKKDKAPRGQVHCYSASVRSNNLAQCTFCAEQHASFKCPTYVNVDDRRARLRELFACLRCGKAGHYSVNCRVRLSCYLCGKNHWTPLCYGSGSNSSNYGYGYGDQRTYDQTRRSNPSLTVQPCSSNNSKNRNTSSKVSQAKPTAKNENKPATATKTVNVAVKSVNSGTNRQGVALPMAKLRILSHGNGGKATLARAMLDSGAQKSFMHPSLVEKLGLKPSDPTEIALTPFGEKSELVLWPKVKVKISIGTHRVPPVEFLVTDKVRMSLNIPGLVETAERLTKDGIKLADNFENDQVDDIMLVIGADYLGHFITGFRKIGKYTMPVSPAGVLLCGPTVMTNNQTVEINNVFSGHISVDTKLPFSAEVSDPPDISNLWELEVIGINKEEGFSPKEKHVFEEFAKTIRYDENQYWVTLPWKEDPMLLPTNYQVARGQLNSLVSKLRKQPEKLKHYDDLLKDYLAQGFIEMVKEETIKGHYLPHHGVEKKSSTTPIRIVFNASSKIRQSMSLNDMLETGPSLTEGLVDSLVRFRTKKYAITADISKAFLRIGLAERDRDFVRFLWVSDPFSDNPTVVTYRFRAVLFGSTSSPFLLQATLHQHFQNSDSEYKDLMSQSFYVDNFATTVNEEKDLIKVYDEVSKCLQQAGMPMQLWNSNSCKFNAFVADKEREVTTGVLGLLWDTRGDVINLKPLHFSPVMSLTKRKALSITSSIFDPLGLLAPVTLRGRLLLRDIWLAKTSWDEPLAENFITRMNELIEDFKIVHTVQFPRCVIEDDNVDLLVDCDASQEAYGACAYVVKDEHARLYMARSRVAPLKARSIPQLELTALLVGWRLVKYICDTGPFRFRHIRVRSDNQACLCWIKNQNSSEVYVRNRVHEIERLSSSYPGKTCYVKSKENLADILSRGSSVADLLTSNWKGGPISTAETLTPEDDPPSILVNEITTQQVILSKVEPIFSVNRYSSLRKLFGVTEQLFKHLELRLKGRFKAPQVSVYWIRTEQRVHYPHVYHCLKNSEKGEGYKESLKFIQDLALYLDQQGIIRSQGRLNHAKCGVDMKHPILLPPKSFLCTLIIRDVHGKHQHCGTRETLNHLRNEFWVPKGRQTVKKVVEPCTYCKYFNGRTFTYPGPPPLPSERVVFDRPFQHTGVDFTGAIETKNEKGEFEKRYVCLFTCLATRAIHLECIDSLSAEAFVNCLRRFVARCSLPDKFFTDNGRNFVAVNKFLISLQEFPEVQDFLHERRISWHFNAPLSPWQGGVFESMIKIVKSALSKALHNRKVKTREFVTLLTEVECMVNDRPLTYLDTEIFNDEALTPAHLLYGRKLKLYPNVILEDTPFDVVSNVNILHAHHNSLSHIISKFKHIWETEYLQSLREKHFSVENKAVRSPKVEEVVLIKTKGNRKSWDLGKVVEIVPGKDNKVREVKVLHNNVTSRMTVDKLIPLEVNECIKLVREPVRTKNKDKEVDSSGKPEVSVRPKRKAAERSNQLRRELIEEDRV